MIDFGNRYVQGGMIFFVTLVAIPTFWDIVLSGPSSAERRVGTPSQIREGRALWKPLKAYSKTNPNAVHQAFMASYRKCAAQHTDVALPDYYYDAFAKPLADLYVLKKEIGADERIDQIADLLKKLSREPASIEDAANTLSRKLATEELMPELINCSLRLSIDDLNI